jgi:F-type H+-transporting ATPase subunit c
LPSIGASSSEKAFWKKANQYRRKEGYMSNRTLISALTAVLVFGMASMAFADDGSAQAAGLWIFFGIALAVGFAIGFAAFGTGIGMGNAINGALQGTARNPEAGGRIMTTMIVGLALIESLCIYAFVVALILYLKLPSFTEFIDKVMH